jgi:hypothetical protein
MPLYQCNAIVRREIHVQVEAENKQEAANKAFKKIQDDGALLLWKDSDDMWTGPEEEDIDEEIEVTKALETNQPPFWDDSEIIKVDSEE